MKESLRLMCFEAKLPNEGDNPAQQHVAKVPNRVHLYSVQALCISQFSFSLFLKRHYSIDPSIRGRVLSAPTTHDIVGKHLFEANMFVRLHQQRISKRMFCRNCLMTTYSLPN